MIFHAIRADVTPVYLVVPFTLYSFVTLITQRQLFKDSFLFCVMHCRIIYRVIRPTHMPAFLASFSICSNVANLVLLLFESVFSLMSLSA